MKILGVSFETHESSVALMEDDRILFAAAEERYSRIKMDNSNPVLSLKECLSVTATKPEDIDVVAISGYPPLKNWYHYAKCFISQKVFARGGDLFVFEHKIKKKRITLKWFPAFIVNLFLSTGIPQFLLLFLVKRIYLNYLLKGFKGRFVYVYHHDCHSVAAVLTSGFDDALSIVTEGLDWEAGFSIDVYEKGKIRNISKSYWPHSPGYYYCLVTSILGFDYMKHAGKITGLAAFGNPDILYDKVAKLLWNDGLQIKVSPLIYILKQEYLLKKRLPDYFAGHSKEDIAAAFQKRLEDVTVEVVKQALKITGKNKIVLSGGVAGNVLMNQRIHDIEGVEEIFIHPAMSDSGQALGAALYVYNEELKKKGQQLKSQRLKDVYLGSGYSNDDIKKSLDETGVEYVCYDNVEKEIAKLLADKKVVARFNGRMEYGPRALGNRSILFHAGDRSANDWLNKRLKRTEFMPFAPSVLLEDRDKYFINVKGAEYTAEFMTITFNCTEKMKKECPAVVHIDGTARPNFVSMEINGSYYKIINEYKKLTGISVILNTSFNMHEEPIVCSPSDAIRSFLHGNLDYLAIGNFLIKNETQIGRVQ